MEMYDIWTSHNSVVEDLRLLGYDTVYIGIQLPNWLFSASLLNKGLNNTPANPAVGRGP